MLDGPPCPAPLAHVWEWFCAFSAQRSGSGFGPNPIGYRDIADWARLNGIKPARVEIECLLAIEGVFFEVRAERDRREKAAHDRSPGR